MLWAALAAGGVAAYAVEFTLGVAWTLALVILATVRGIVAFCRGVRAGYNPPPEDTAPDCVHVVDGKITYEGRRRPLTTREAAALKARATTRHRRSHP